MGMAFGALLPWRLVDEEFLGEQADKLKEGAVELATDGYEKAKSVAQKGYDAATEALRSDGSASGESSASGAAAGFRTSAADRFHN